MLYKPKIKVDCDNVLNNMAETIVRLYNADHQTTFNYDRCETYNFSCYGNRVVEYAANMWDKTPERLWGNMKPPPNAVEGLKKLDEKYDVVIVTAAFPWTFNLTCDYIRRFYPWFLQDNIIRCMDKRWVTTDYAIDDLPHHLVTDVQASRILMDAPWNRSFSEVWHDTFRVKNLVEAYDLITDFEQQNDFGGEKLDG